MLQWIYRTAILPSSMFSQGDCLSLQLCLLSYILLHVQSYVDETLEVCYYITLSMQQTK